MLQRIPVVNEQDVCCLVTPEALDPEVRTLGEHLAVSRNLLTALARSRSAPISPDPSDERVAGARDSLDALSRTPPAGCASTAARQILYARMLSRSVSGEGTVAAIDPAAVAEARSAIPPDEFVEAVVEAFQALADPTRARILYALVRRPLCVRDLAILVGVSESAVSHQLRLLRDRRLVRARRQGNVVYYAVDDHHVAALFREAEYHVDHVRQGTGDHPYPLP